MLIVDCGRYHEVHLGDDDDSSYVTARKGGLVNWPAMGNVGVETARAMARAIDRACDLLEKVKNQPPDLTAGEFNRSE